MTAIVRRIVESVLSVAPIAEELAEAHSSVRRRIEQTAATRGVDAAELYRTLVDDGRTKSAAWADAEALARSIRR